MQTYLALARLAFQRQLSYRTANLAGLVTNAFFGALRAAVLVALFGAQTSAAGYSVQAAVTYTGLTQALLAYIAIFGWWDMMRSIRTGEVAAHLAQPVNYFFYWGAQDCGRALGQLLWRGLPIMLLYALIYHIAWPPTIWHWLALLAALPLALFISFAWRFIVSLAAFWTHDAIGVGRAAWTVSIFCSGFMMPVAFYPPGLARLMRLTPFPAMISTPVEIYLGLIDGRGLLTALFTQLAWCALLYAAAQVALAAGVKKLVIHGG